MPKDRALLDWMRVDRKDEASLQEQVRYQLLAAIGDGRLISGDLLPSSRVLARQLGVSRGTVLAAFEQLLGDGLLETRGGSATAVSKTVLASKDRSELTVPVGAQTPFARVVHHDLGQPVAAPQPEFLPGVPAFDIFPRERWARLISARSRQMSLEFADNDFHIGGYRPLRAALAAHLRTARGVLCTDERVIVTSSARAALSITCRLLTQSGDRCLVEDPGYITARTLIAGCGLRPLSIPVDSGGIQVEPSLPAARLAYLTPTHQWPLGVRLANSRRAILVEWTRRHNAWIIEDDYDSEFRYTGEAVVALQNDDPDGRVIYIGTFAKTLFPSLRVAFLIVPSALADLAAHATFLAGHEPTLHVQAALADFIVQGHYARHIRRARKIYRRRQGLLVDAINHHLADIASLERPSGGMQVILPLPANAPASMVQESAAAAHLHVRALGIYADLAIPPNALQLGFAAVPEHRIEPAVRRLGEVIRVVATGPSKR